MGRRLTIPLGEDLGERYKSPGVVREHYSCYTTLRSFANRIHLIRAPGYSRKIARARRKSILGCLPVETSRRAPLLDFPIRLHRAGIVRYVLGGSVLRRVEARTDHDSELPKRVERALNVEGRRRRSASGRGGSAGGFFGRGHRASLRTFVLAHRHATWRCQRYRVRDLVPLLGRGTSERAGPFPRFPFCLLRSRTRAPSKGPAASLRETSTGTLRTTT
jgi:hypothetical protein